MSSRRGRQKNGIGLPAQLVEVVAEPRQPKASGIEGRSDKQLVLVQWDGSMAFMTRAEATALGVTPIDPHEHAASSESAKGGWAVKPKLSEDAAIDLEVLARTILSLRSPQLVPPLLSAVVLSLENGLSHPLVLDLLLHLAQPLTQGLIYSHDAAVAGHASDVLLRMIKANPELCRPALDLLTEYVEALGGQGHPCRTDVVSLWVKAMAVYHPDLLDVDKLLHTPSPTPSHNNRSTHAHTRGQSSNSSSSSGSAGGEEEEEEEKEDECDEQEEEEDGKDEGSEDDDEEDEEEEEDPVDVLARRPFRATWRDVSLLSSVMPTHTHAFYALVRAYMALADQARIQVFQTKERVAFLSRAAEVLKLGVEEMQKKHDPHPVQPKGYDDEDDDADEDGEEEEDEDEGASSGGRLRWRRGGKPKMLVIEADERVKVPLSITAGSNEHMALNLSTDVTTSHWVSTGTGSTTGPTYPTRTIFVTLPVGVPWHRVEILCNDYGNYSPEEVNVRVTDAQKAQLFEKRGVRLVQRLEWVTLVRSDEWPTTPRQVVSGLTVTVEIARNFSNGIETKVAGLRAFGARGGKSIKLPGKLPSIKAKKSSTFGVTDQPGIYNVPQTGRYRIIAIGGRAADGQNRTGGKGAHIEATFKLKRGDRLHYIVGGASTRSTSTDSGGGGGTFVALNGTEEQLIVAGGGGGTRGADQDVHGADASLTEDGLNGVGPNGGTGGKSGQDGTDGVDSSYGRGGRGFRSVWANGGEPNGSTMGSRQPGDGGFGGGGKHGSSGGGGGGGYSGGAGGRGAGGGGSYIHPVYGKLAVKKISQDTTQGSLTISLLKTSLEDDTATAAAGQKGAIKTAESLGVVDKIRFVLLGRIAGETMLLLDQVRGGRIPLSALSQSAGSHDDPLAALHRLRTAARGAMPESHSLYRRLVSPLWSTRFDLRCTAIRALHAQEDDDAMHTEAVAASEEEERRHNQKLISSLLSEWDSENELGRVAGIEESLLRALRRRFTKHVLLPAYDGHHLKSMLRSYMSCVDLRDANALETRRLLQMILDNARQSFVADIREAWTDAVSDEVFAVLESFKPVPRDPLPPTPTHAHTTHTTHLHPAPTAHTNTPSSSDRASFVWRLVNATHRLLQLVPIDERNMRRYFLFETEKGFAQAWRRLPRNTAADISEALALSANRLLDPHRSDVTPSLRAEWHATLTGIGQAVDMLANAADIRWFYEQLLARRLLRGRTMGAEVEQSALAILCLDNHTLKGARDMLRDVRASDDFVSAYLSYELSRLSDAPPSVRVESLGWTLSGGGTALGSSLMMTAGQKAPPQISIVVTTPGAWPLGCIDKAPLTLPTPVHNTLQGFGDFFVRSAAKSVDEDGETFMVPLHPPTAPHTHTTHTHAHTHAVSSVKLTVWPRAGSVVLTYVFFGGGSSEGGSRVGWGHVYVGGGGKGGSGGVQSVSSGFGGGKGLESGGGSDVTTRSIDLFVTPTQACILLLFNESPTWTWQGLLTKLGLAHTAHTHAHTHTHTHTDAHASSASSEAHTFLADQLRPLTMVSGEVQALLKVEVDRSIKPSVNGSGGVADARSQRVYTLNPTFHPPLSMSLLVVHGISTGEKGVREGLEQKLGRAMAWRHQLVESACVRIAKKAGGKPVAWEDLVGGVRACCSDRQGEVTSHDVTLAVEHLVDAGYLKRVASVPTAPTQTGVIYDAGGDATGGKPPSPHAHTSSMDMDPSVSLSAAADAHLPPPPPVDDTRLVDQSYLKQQTDTRAFKGGPLFPLLLAKLGLPEGIEDMGLEGWQMPYEDQGIIESDLYHKIVERVVGPRLVTMLPSASIRVQPLPSSLVPSLTTTTRPAPPSNRPPPMTAPRAANAARAPQTATRRGSLDGGAAGRGGGAVGLVGGEVRVPTVRLDKLMAAALKAAHRALYEEYASLLRQALGGRDPPTLPDPPKVIVLEKVKALLRVWLDGPEARRLHRVLETMAIGPSSSPSPAPPLASPQLSSPLPSSPSLTSPTLATLFSPPASPPGGQAATATVLTGDNLVPLLLPHLASTVDPSTHDDAHTRTHTRVEYECVLGALADVCMGMYVPMVGRMWTVAGAAGAWGAKRRGAMPPPVGAKADDPPVSLSELSTVLRNMVLTAIYHAADSAHAIASASPGYVPPPLTLATEDTAITTAASPVQLFPADDDFVAVLRSLAFAQLDMNGDGILTYDDVIAAAQAKEQEEGWGGPSANNDTAFAQPALHPITEGEVLSAALPRTLSSSGPLQSDTHTHSPLVVCVPTPLSTSDRGLSGGSVDDSGAVRRESSLGLSASDAGLVRELSTSMEASLLHQKAITTALAPAHSETILRSHWSFTAEEDVLGQAVELMDEQIGAVASMFQLEHGTAALLVQACDWDCEAVIDKLLTDARSLLASMGLPEVLHQPALVDDRHVTGSDAECNVCSEEGVIRLTACRHQMCPTCLQAFLTAEVQERKGLPIRCPQHTSGCKSLIPITALRLTSDAATDKQVLVWPLPREVGEDKMCELKDHLRDEISIASHGAIRPADVLVATDYMKAGLDYALVTLSTDEDVCTFLDLCNDDKALTLRGRRMYARRGGWIAAHERNVLRLFASKLFVYCRNPRACKGIVFTGLGRRWASNSTPSSSTSSSSEALSTVRCGLCQEAFCKECASAIAHAPATCKMMSDWEDKGGVMFQNEEDVANRALIAKIAKTCPRCNAPIEKNEGCQHMTCRAPSCGHEFCWLCLGPWRDHGGGCISRTQESRGSQAHFQELDKEATNYIVGARIAYAQRDRARQALSGVGGQASILVGPGRRIARLRAEAWSLVSTALETLYAATVAAYFIPSSVKEVFERYEYLRGMLRQCVDRIQEALEHELQLPEGAIPGTIADKLLHDRYAEASTVRMTGVLRTWMAGFLEVVGPMVLGASTAPATASTKGLKGLKSTGGAAVTGPDTTPVERGFGGQRSYLAIDLSSPVPTLKLPRDDSEGLGGTALGAELGS